MALESCGLVPSICPSCQPTVVKFGPESIDTVVLGKFSLRSISKDGGALFGEPDRLVLSRLVAQNILLSFWMLLLTYWSRNHNCQCVFSLLTVH